MTDLKDLLRETAETGSGPALDPRAVLAGGRRRVRRRRVAGFAAVAAVVVAAGVAVGAGVLPTRGPLPATGPGRFLRVEVPRAQAISRCTDAVTQQNTDVLRDESQRYVPLQGTAQLDGRTVRQPPQPWYEGTVLYFVEADHPRADTYECMVPQASQQANAGRLPRNAVTARHAAGFREECGTFAGIDLTGWPLVAAATGDLQTVGLFASRNGMTLQCRFDDDYDLSGSRPRIVVELGATHDAGQQGAPAVGPTGNRVWVACNPAQDPVTGNRGTCYGAGEAYDAGKPVAALRVTTPGGTRTVRVHGRYYAFALPVPTTAPYATYRSVRVTSLAADGSVIATHRVQPLPPKIRWE